LAGAASAIEARAGQFGGHRQRLRRRVRKPSTAKPRAAPARRAKRRRAFAVEQHGVHGLLGGAFLVAKEFRSQRRPEGRRRTSRAAWRIFDSPASAPAALRSVAIPFVTARPRRRAA
jgi:hypothetical protein